MLPRINVLKKGNNCNLTDYTNQVISRIIYIDLFGSDKVDSNKVESYVKNRFDLSPRGIIDMLGLSNPIYSVTSAYGHFGRKPDKNGNFSWEKLDIAKEFQDELL